MKRLVKGGAAVFLAISFVLGAVAHFVPRPTDLARVLEAPSWAHPFGFDSLGRDLFWRSLEGYFSSFVLATTAGLIAALTGIAVGAIAGLRGGSLDLVCMRLIDVLEALPNLMLMAVLLLIWRVFVDSDDALSQFVGLALALGLTGWLDLARQMRALTLRERSMHYMEAAVAVGASKSRIVIRHLWPNIKHSLWLLMLLHIPGFVLFESTLSFFGLGLRSPQTSLGQILLEGWKILTLSSHVIAGPTALMFLAMISFQILLWGDVLKTDSLKARNLEAVNRGRLKFLRRR